MNPSESVNAIAPSVDPRSKLLLIDGHSLAFRSYYAFAKGRDGGLRTSTGIPTSICFGFLKSLIDVIKTEQPEYLAVAFDLGGPTYRHEADDQYKAGRVDTPEDFIPDIKNLQELLTALSLPIVTAPGYEADDVIGTLTRQAAQQGWCVKILSGDRDLFQLVDDAECVQVLYLSNAFGAARGNANAQPYGPKEVLEKLGVRPDQVVDYKALCGDSSDNIPGVKGIGHKTAVQLLEQYNTLENIYASLDSIKGAVQKKLADGHNEARHSQYLAQIHLSVPLEVQPQDFHLKGFNVERVTPLLEKLELQSLLRQLPALQQQLGGSAAATAQLQSLSDDDLWFFSAEDSERIPVIAPQIVDTPAKLAQLVVQLQTCTDPTQPVAWDTETTSLSPRDAQLVGIGCCWQDDPSAIAYIPIHHAEGQTLSLEEVLIALRPILESEAYPKALQNAKFDRLVLQFQGINLAGVVFDTMLASYVLNPETSHNLTDLSYRYLSITAQSYTELVPKGKTVADLPIERVAEYCGIDAYATFQLVLKLQEKLVQFPKLQSLLTAVEIPLEPVLAAMETYGIRIDQPYLKTLSDQLALDLQALEVKAYELAGEAFNLGSPKQLSEIFFTKLGLDTKKSRKTKLGYSTDAATLEKLQGDHPLVDVLLEHRTLAKLKSTYVDALPTLVRPDTHRVHTDFNQAVTATGRLSSSNPNLQNIPIRTAFSRQIRAAFIPEPDWILLSADYSQIELRILAHLSAEPRLVEAYQNNQDVHTLTAQLLLEKEPHTITVEERRLAKIINFGVIYGMGAQRFSREAGVSYSDAKTFIERFYERYPEVFAYLQRTERQAISQGYVETLLGRRRYFQFDSPSLKQLQGKPLEEVEAVEMSTLKINNYERGQLRAAANAPIQGSSADLIKIAMVQLQKALAPYQARLLLQVHDELVLEVHPTDFEAVTATIQQTMEQALPLRVPLQAEVHSGENWMVAK